MSIDSYEEVKNSRNFSGKVVLVTGSSTGIGAGIVKLFSFLGAKVVVTGRNETNIKRVAEECHKLSPYGLKPLQVVADLAVEHDIIKLVNETIKEFGTFDVLVNNAGIWEFSSIKDNHILEQYDRAMQIDVRSALELIHLSIPYLEKSKGTIINISSISSLRPQSGFLSYSMAKTSINMMTSILAIELGPTGIRVNTISPGVIDSKTTKTKEDLEIIETYGKRAPLRRVGEPLDIAKGVVFLSSTDAQFITGANLVIDGGLMYNLS